MSQDVSQNLTRNQARAITALLAHRRIEDAATEVGLNPRTISRWMDEPGFLRALRAAETAAISDAVRMLISDLKANQEVMRSIRDNRSNSARVRLSAAQSLDDSALRWRNIQNVDERLAALEREIFGHGHK